MGGGSVTIATTRPETMLGDTAVAVHPDDERYTDLVGKTAVLPLLGRELKIVADERVDPAFGTGALKITPAHDLTDFDIGRTHGLETVQAIGQDGRITEAGGPYAGLEVEEAAERVIADLRALGALVKVEDYPHSVATCDRCGTPIEPLISEQWFMDMDELKKPATDVVRDGKVKFTPERWGRVYIDWMDNLRPWCISRQLWWGHQLPVWYCPDGHLTVAESEPQACADVRLHRAHARDRRARHVVQLGALAVRHLRLAGRRPPDLAYFYPTNVLSTARDIIFLWVARMIMMGLEFMDDIPFDDVYIHSVIQAPDGRRMSKSLGTGIDPLEMIDEHGADATRFGLLLMSSTQDVRFSEEKIAMGRGFANKLWNAARFVLLGSEGYAAERSEAAQVDRWITSRFQRCLATVEEAVAVYDFTAAVDALYHFVWDEFCDWYLELIKVPLYGEDEAKKAQAAGHARWMLDQIVRLLHPFMPFVTEEIAEQYGAAPLLRQQHPRRDEAQLAPDDEKAIGELQAAVDALRRFRAEAEIPPGKVLAAVFVGDAGAAERYAHYAGVFRALARTDARLRGRAGGGRDRRHRARRPARGGGRRRQGGGDRPPRAAARQGSRPRSQRGEAKLGNEKFVGRAPEAVVAKEREKLAGHVAERDGLAARLAQLREA